MKILVVAGVAALGLLTGCGNQSADETAAPAASSTPGDATSATPSPSPTPTGRSAAEIAKLPTCASVWRTGATLPRSYDACRVGAVAKEPRKKGCSSGQTLVFQDMHWFSVPGGKIGGGPGAAGHKAAIQALRDCRG